MRFLALMISMLSVGLVLLLYFEARDLRAAMEPARGMAAVNIAGPLKINKSVAPPIGEGTLRICNLGDQKCSRFCDADDAQCAAWRPDDATGIRKAAPGEGAADLGVTINGSSSGCNRSVEDCDHAQHLALEINKPTKNDEVVIGKPTSGSTLIGGAINAAPDMPLFKNGEPAMTETEWRAKQKSEPVVVDAPPATDPKGWGASPSITFAAPSCDDPTIHTQALAIYAQNGDLLVSIDQCTGKVTIGHPERMDKDARTFWRAIQYAFPQVCKVKK